MGNRGLKASNRRPFSEPFRTAQKRKASPSQQVRNWARHTFTGEFNQRFYVKGLALTFVVLALSGGLFLWAAQPSNGLFHSQIPQQYCTSTNFKNCVGDPSNLIGDFAGNNMNGYNFQNAASISGLLTMQPNSTFPAIAISKAQVDLSSANSRELVFDTEMVFGATVNTATFDAYQYYLTTNAQLSTSPTYNPLNDPAVIFDVGMGNCGMNGCEYDVFMSNNQTGTLNGQNFGGCLPNSSIVNGCPTVAMPSGAGDAMDAVFLNYTGVNGVSSSGQNGVSCAAIGNTIGGTNRCSSLDYNGNNFFTFVGQSANTWRTYPRLSLTRYYVGFFVLPTNRGTINTNFIATTNLGFGTTDAMIIYNFLPAATASPPPAPIQGGGFFRPVIDLLIQVGVFMAQTIINFLSFLYNLIAPLLTSAATIVGNVLVAIMNALGSIFGDGNLGTQISTAFTNIVNYLTNIFAGAVAIWSNILTALLNILNFVVKFLSITVSGGATLFAFIESFFSTMVNFWSVFVGVWNQFMKFYIAGSFTIQYILVGWWIWGMYENFRSGVKNGLIEGWLRPSETFLLGLFKGGYWLLDEAYKFVVQLKQLIFGNRISPGTIAGNG